MVCWRAVPAGCPCRRARRVPAGLRLRAAPDELRGDREVVPLRCVEGACREQKGYCSLLSLSLCLLLSLILSYLLLLLPSLSSSLVYLLFLLLCCSCRYLCFYHDYYHYSCDSLCSCYYCYCYPIRYKFIIGVITIVTVMPTPAIVATCGGFFLVVSSFTL